MHVRIWPLLVSLAVIAGCSAPPPEEEMSPAAGESTAATEPAAEAQEGGALADEGFEAGRPQTLEQTSTPAAGEQAE
jgi:hypothetical protein